LREALAEFGEGVEAVVRYYCRVRYGLELAELRGPGDVAALASCLLEVFGPASRVVEERMLARACSALKVDRGSLPKDFKEALTYLVTRCGSSCKPAPGGGARS
jgi:hypothetical protein